MEAPMRNPIAFPQRIGPESGLSLVGILISLALAGVVLALGAEFFESAQQTQGTEQAVLSLEREAARIHNLLATQIADAGFGFPESCAQNGAVLANWPASSGLSDNNIWYPVAGTSSGGLSFLESEKSLGDVAVTTITDMPSLQSDSFRVVNTQNLFTGNGLAVEVPVTACFASVIHSSSTSSNREVTYIKYNGTSFGTLAQNAGVPLSASQMTHARVYDLGQISAYDLILNGTDLQETLSSQATNWQPQTVTLSRRVLAWSVQVGTGNPLQWESAAQWASQEANGNGQPILAVQIGMVLASNNAYSNAQTPTQVALMGHTVALPSGWQGHLIKTFVWSFAVRNAIWESGNG